MRKEKSMPEIRRHGPIIALAVLAGLMVAIDLAAQDPKTPPLTPINPRTKPISPSHPNVKQPVSDRDLIDPQALRMTDLQLTIRPQSMSRAPSVFTVENIGPVGTTRASLLRVTVRLLPLDAMSRSDVLTEGRDSGRRLNLDLGFSPGRLIGGDDGLTDSEFAELCPPPFDDFEAAIDPLDIGETQAISQSGTDVTGVIRNVGLVAHRPATRIPTHSYIREIQVRLVCVYELRAMVDANREIQELLERNNEVVHIFQREVTLR
ncbi:MAG: hypothetical protein ACREK5_02485 [Gemmatimonadota bacterium]